VKSGKHFPIMTEGHEQLEAFGKTVLWTDAQPIEFSSSSEADQPLAFRVVSLLLRHVQSTGGAVPGV